jgi:hypothetical protein
VSDTAARKRRLVSDTGRPRFSAARRGRSQGVAPRDTRTDAALVDSVVAWLVVAFYVLFRPLVERQLQTR